MKLKAYDANFGSYGPHCFRCHKAVESYAILDSCPIAIHRFCVSVPTVVSTLARFSVHIIKSGSTANIYSLREGLQRTRCAS